MTMIFLEYGLNGDSHGAGSSVHKIQCCELTSTTLTLKNQTPRSRHNRYDYSRIEWSS